MASNVGEKSTEIPKSKDHRVVYAQVQQWTVTDTEVIISFLRAQPNLADTNGKLGTTGASWVNEATVYLPIPQAKQMSEMLLESIDKHFSPTSNRH